MEGCGSYEQQDVTVQMSISVRMKTHSQKLVKVMKYNKYFKELNLL